MKVLVAILLSLALVGSVPAQYERNSNLANGGLPWSTRLSPSTGSQATITMAGVAGHRHVVTCIAFAGASVSAPSLTFLTVNLRDSTTGAGTILMQFPIAVAASTGQNIPPFGLCGLTIIGTAGNAITLEFSAGLANLAESVNISGFDL